MRRLKRQADSPSRVVENATPANIGTATDNEQLENGHDSVATGDQDADSSAPKVPRLEYPEDNRIKMRSCCSLTLKWFSSPKDDGGQMVTPADDCVFLLYQFRLIPWPAYEGLFGDYCGELRRINNPEVRVYCDLMCCYGNYQREKPDSFLYSASLQGWPLIYCKTDDIPSHVFRHIGEKRLFTLTYDDDFSTISIWVKKSLFSDDPNGSDALRPSVCHVMATLFPDLCHGNTEAAKPIGDKPQTFYEELKVYKATEKLSKMEFIKPPDIVPALRPYQKEAISWMLKREIGDSMETTTNPLFVEVADFRANGKFYYYNPFGGYFMTDRPPGHKAVRGGILAEEMGLGKTVEMLSLILANPKEHDRELEELVVDDDKPNEEGTEKDRTCLLETEEAFQSKTLEEIRYRRERRELYQRKPEYKPKSDKDSSAAALSCFCGRSAIETDPSPRMYCPQCSTWQHASCVRWHLDSDWSDAANYLCPSCRCSKPEFAVAAKTTLIVSPSSISDQWYAEIKKHVRSGALSVYIYRGVQNEGFIQPHKLAEYDVVVVAYETLRSELDYLESIDRCQLRRPRRFAAAPSPLAAVIWYRLCLDEAQMVESASAKAAKMCLRLRAKYKWCVTGTPLQKSVKDLYGLFLLLNVDPYSIRQFWDMALYNPYVNGASRRLLETVSPLLRRTEKADVLDQLNIPEQGHQLRMIDFGPVEEHFYYRTQQQCVQLFGEAMDSVNRQRRIGRLDDLDRGMRLDSLERHVLDQLLRPLWKLRQACCHPQLVRGQFVNFEQVQQRMRVVTMDVVLDEMIKKTTRECEDFHRAYVASLNGLAALEWQLGRWQKAAEWYREGLRSCQELDKEETKGDSAASTKNDQANAKPVVRTDLLQKLHAMYNLNALLKAHGKTIPPTLRDDKLSQECFTLKEKYLFQSSHLVEKSQADLKSCQSTLTQELDSFLPVWYMRVLRQLSENESEPGVLVDRLQQALMDTNWWTRFRDTSGLIYLITTHSDALLQAREELSNAVKQLSGLDLDAMVTDAQVCHLRPGVAGGKEGQGGGWCAMCVVDPLFEDYESKLFNIENAENGAGPAHAVVQGVNDELVNIMGPLRRVTWADSDLERALKALYSFANRSSNRGHIEPHVLDSARKYMKVFESLKQEFRAMRSTWTSIRDHVSRRDELAMAVQRLTVDERRIVTEMNQLLTDRMASQNSLKRQLGRLSYLANLRQSSQTNEQNTDDSNPEECPICTQSMGSKWIVLSNCCHRLCIDCHRTISNGRESCRCPICRCVSHHVQEVVFKKPQERKQQVESKYTIIGSHSAKIAAVVRCILEIRDTDQGAKCLVFSEWREVLELVSNALRENGLKHKFLTAGGDKFRQGLMEFKTSPDCTILLLPLKNGANGLNIIEATHVLLVEPSMNIAREQQALGRVHRIGQTKKTTVHRFLVRESVEEKIYRICGCEAVKMDGPLVENGDAHVPKLTVGDLMDLFPEAEENEPH